MHISPLKLVNINKISDGFYENFTYPASINKMRIITPKSVYTNLVQNSLLSSLSLLGKSIEDEI